jgi:hypothetical protein
MKVGFTDDALRDLDEILHHISTNYPGVYAVFETPSARHCHAHRYSAGKRARSAGMSGAFAAALAQNPVANFAITTMIATCMVPCTATTRT